MDVTKENVYQENSREGNANGIAENDLIEKEALIEELFSREETATGRSETKTAPKQQEKATAEDMRKKGDGDPKREE